MKKRDYYWKFKVAGNSNTYFATSLKAINHFLRVNGLVLTDFYTYLPFTEERKTAEHIDWGVWCIPDNN